MEENGIVVKLYRGGAVVRINRKSECESCKLCMFSKNAQYIDVRAKNEMNAKIGEDVKITFTASSQALSAVVVYMIPLLFAFIGLIVGYFALNSEIWMAVFCFVFLAIAYIIVGCIDRALAKKRGYAPEIIEILNEESNKTNE